jgi:hypothetical protein
MNTSKPLTIIGRAEKVRFIDFSEHEVVAKVDTGADLSSIWASDVHEAKSHLHFKLFGEGSPYYTGHQIVLPPSAYRLTRVANSFGQKELRYVVRLRLVLAGRTVKVTFTLADRSDKLYPILLGRRLLKGKFLVDVSQGEPLHAKEKVRKRQLEAELKQLTDISEQES